MLFISVIPAQPGYLSSVKDSSRHGEPVWPWRPWRVVIAWGFDKHDSRPIPITAAGAPNDEQEWRIKTPEGEVVVL